MFNILINDELLKYIIKVKTFTFIDKYIRRYLHDKGYENHGW